MRRGLRTQLTLTIAWVVFVTVLIITLSANSLIDREFVRYAEKQRQTRAENIVASLEHQYDAGTGSWETGYVHGVGMSVLAEGYVIRVYDQNGDLIWDAENHDMSQCEQIMTEIANRMAAARPGSSGGFVTEDFELTQNGLAVGKVAIISFGPYFFTDHEFRFLSGLNAILLVTGLLSLVLSLVVGLLLARRIASPIIKTAQIARQIAAGNFGRRAQAQPRTAELAELVAAVNQMADFLSRQENLRRRLTTNVAHELRTPLSAVASHLELMIEGIWDPTPQRLQGCYDEIGRLAGLVADLEQLAQVESDNLNLQKTAVDLLDLSRTVSSTFESESVKKHIVILVEGDQSIVNADKDRLHQVLANLLSNAIKYTPEHGHILVTVKDMPDQCILTVDDDGIGIPAEDLPLIFERFYRTDKSRSRQTGGAGIGLAIAKSIVTAHGGQINAESTVNRGSRFTIVLPKQNISIEH